MKYERIETRSAFEPALKPLYILIAASAAGGAALMLALGFSVTFSALAIVALPAYIVFGGIMARRIGWARTATALECGALLYQQGFVTLMILYPLAALSGPYSDQLLSSWDRALGFNWIAYFEAVRPSVGVLRFVYRSFAWQPAVLVLGLILYKEELVLFRLVTAAFVAGLVTAIVFPFFPAQAPLIYYGVTAPELPGADFLPKLEAIRNGARLISPETFTGMVAFPSYHSVAAVQFAWAGWRIPPLRWLLVLINVAMLAAIPIAGNHYFVDVIAGVFVGVLSIGLARYLSGRT